MEKYFSQKFKQLRKAQNLTQEQVAELFNVSPQSVSRWEIGANYPDVELLPHIALFFKVTVDELLGTGQLRDTEKAKVRIKEIRRLFTLGKLEGALKAARDAVRENPVQYDLQVELLNALCHQRDNKYKDEIIQTAEKIIRFFENAGANEHEAQDIVLQVKHTLFEQYISWGMTDEAIGLVRAFPSHWYSHEANVGLVLTGEEFLQEQAIIIAQYTNLLCWAIQRFAEKSGPGITQKIEWHKKVVRIKEEIFDDETDVILWGARQHLNSYIAELFCQAGDTENALLYVERATHDALHQCTVEYTGYKSSIFIGRKYGHMHNVSPDTRNVCWALWETVLAKPEFNLIRQEERFRKCIETLKAHSHEIKDFWN